MCKSRRWVETATALRNYSRAAMTSAIDGHSIPGKLKNVSRWCTILVWLGIAVAMFDAQRKPALRGLYRCRSTGSAEHSGDPLPGSLPAMAFSLATSSSFHGRLDLGIRNAPFKNTSNPKFTKSSRVASRHENAPPGMAGLSLRVLRRSPSEGPLQS